MGSVGRVSAGNRSCILLSLCRLVEAATVGELVTSHACVFAVEFIKQLGVNVLGLLEHLAPGVNTPSPELSMVSEVQIRDRQSKMYLCLLQSIKYLISLVIKSDDCRDLPLCFLQDQQKKLYCFFFSPLQYWGLNSGPHVC
jgi:hypothetical protein